MREGCRHTDMAAHCNSPGCPWRFCDCGLRLNTSTMTAYDADTWHPVELPRNPEPT